MTIGQIKTRVDFYCGKTTALSATDGLIALNNAVYEIETEILMAQGNWKYDDSNNADLPILTTNLVASQQDYTLPTELIRIDRIEVSIDGTNWYRATPINTTEDSRASPERRTMRINGRTANESDVRILVTASP